MIANVLDIPDFEGKMRILLSPSFNMRLYAAFSYKRFV
jgi:hypothetical protein